MSLNIVETVTFEGAFNAGNRLMCNVSTPSMKFKLNLWRKHAVSFIMSVSDITMKDLTMNRCNHSLLFNVVITSGDTDKSWGKWYVNLNKLTNHTNPTSPKSFEFRASCNHSGPMLMEGSVNVIGVPTTNAGCEQAYGKHHTINVMPDSLVDVTFVCSDGVQVGGCRALLATVSEVFMSMFSGQFSDQNTIQVPDVLAHDMKRLVNYSITRQYEVSDNDESFVIACHKYMIYPVTKQWCALALERLNTDNTINTLNVADHIDAKDLYMACAVFIKRDASQIKDIDTLDKQTLVDILTLS